jgi:hypothetical protein
VSLVPRCPELRRIPQHRSEGEEHGRCHADPAPDRQQPEHPPGDADVDRPDDREDELAVRVVAPGGHEGEQQDGRQRRERDVSARHAVTGRHLADVVEEGVPRRRIRRFNRIANRRLALEERLGLPLEVVVVTEGLRVRVDDKRDPGECEPDSDRDQPRPGRPPSQLGRAWAGRQVRSGYPIRTLCYAAIHLKTLVQEASLL